MSAVPNGVQHHPQGLNGLWATTKRRSFGSVVWAMAMDATFVFRERALLLGRYTGGHRLLDRVLKISVLIMEVET
jgi:hypothetical protein